MTELRVVLDKYSFLEGPRWHEGRLSISDFYTHRVVSCDEPAATRGWRRRCRPNRPGWAGCRTVGCWSSRCATTPCCAGSRTVGWPCTPSSRSTPPGMLNDMVVDARGRAWVGNFGFDLMAGGAARGPAGPHPRRRHHGVAASRCTSRTARDQRPAPWSWPRRWATGSARSTSTPRAGSRTGGTGRCSAPLPRDRRRRRRARSAERGPGRDLRLDAEGAHVGRRRAGQPSAAGPPGRRDRGRGLHRGHRGLRHGPRRDRRPHPVPVHRTRLRRARAPAHPGGPPCWPPGSRCRRPERYEHLLAELTSSLPEERDRDQHRASADRGGRGCRCSTGCAGCARSSPSGATATGSGTCSGMPTSRRSPGTRPPSPTTPAGSTRRPGRPSAA